LQAESKNIKEDGEVMSDSNESKKKRKGKGATEVRYDLVNDFRLSLERGNYLVRAQEIADKMVQKIRDARNPWVN